MVAVVALLMLLAVGPARAFEYVEDAEGTWWGIQDASSPSVDTGSVRATQDAPWDDGAYTTLITGYGGVRLHVDTDPEPRMNGEMLRGFGLEFDGEDDFVSTRSVELGGVWATRSVHVETSSNWGRWLDTFTNTTRREVTIRVAFGGQTGVGDASSTCSRCAPAPIVMTSSGDGEVDPADAWTTAASATDGDSEVSGPIVTVLGTPSTRDAPFDGALDFAGTWLWDTFDNPLVYSGHEGNFPAYVTTLTLEPRESASLLHYVVIGSPVTEATAEAEQVDAEATAADLAAAPDLSGLDTAEVCSITNFDRDALSAGGFDVARCDGRRADLRIRQPRPPLEPRTVTSTDYDVVGKTMGELRADMEAGVTTSVEITKAYLDRIAAYDTGQFGFNAYEIVAGDSLAQARAADRARNRGKSSPVLGIPVAIKNLYDTYDMATTNGSFTFAGFQPDEDAFQVAQLREAGAVIIGKAALEEYATSGSYSNDAWGQVWNAFDPSKSPLASSGGSAVAVATGMAAAAMGSQTGDSLYAPASAASLVTLRGTDGLQSSSGIMPLLYLFDYGGAMTQSVSDLADMLNVVAGTDPEDPVTAPADDHIPADWRDLLDLDALEGKRIGWIPAAWEDPFGTTAVLDASMDALQYLEDGGATIVEIGSTVGGTDSPPRPDVPAPSGDIRQEGWMRYIDAHPELQEQGFDIRNAVDVECSQVKVPYERENPEDCWREPAPRLTDEELQAHFDYRITLQETLAAWMDEAEVDAVVYPGLLSDISLNDGGGNQRSFGRRDTPSARYGSPTVVVPAGLSDRGEPVAIQLLGRAWDDDELVGMAYAYEQRANAADDGRVLPDTVPALRKGWALRPLWSAILDGSAPRPARKDAVEQTRVLPRIRTAD